MYTLKQYKIKANSEEQSKLIQNELFRLGFNWGFNFDEKEHLHVEFPFLFTSEMGRISVSKEGWIYRDKILCKEITLEQLKEEKSIAEIISEQLTGTEIVLEGEMNSKNIYYNSKIEVVLKDFYIDLHLDCQQELGVVSGEEEVGIANGTYIDNEKEIKINQLMIIVYDKTIFLPYTYISETLTSEIEKELVKRLKFEN